MKKILMVSMLVLILLTNLTTFVRASDVIDINDFETIENGNPTPQPNPQPNPQTEGTEQTEQTDKTVAKTQNPQTGIKEEAPIVIATIIGIGIAVYAGRKIKKYSY
ncbi:MAG TPA: hypothetical protein PK993_01290 [Clostridia bacterium]|nr:hypothetical protein [Clostridia bacterium]